MEAGRGPAQFVLVSSVRSDIVDVLGEGPGTTDGLLGSLDASRSAVYNGLGELEERGLIEAADEGWELTGSGRLVADIVRQHRRCERLFADAGEYLRTHDTAALPREFRLRLGELAGATVLSATETEPHRAVTEVASRIEGAERARVISPIYVEAYETAMPDTEGCELILDERVALSAIEADADSEAEYEHLAVRVAEVNFALGVTGDELLLSLPTLEGSYDSRSEVIAEHDRARRWGADLFERVWDRATPLGQFQRAHSR